MLYDSHLAENPDTHYYTQDIHPDISVYSMAAVIAAVEFGVAVVPAVDFCNNHYMLHSPFVAVAAVVAAVAGIDILPADRDSAPGVSAVSVVELRYHLTGNLSVHMVMRAVTEIP